MATNNINNELKNAVYSRNLEQIKALLCAGANANFRVCRSENTLLHTTDSVEVAKELLLGGADVNARNTYNDTPLHSAIIGANKLELVRELLKHGAYVNATKRKDNTPLNLAVRKSHKNLEVVKELLKYGADINIRNREKRTLYHNEDSSPLDNAVGDLECAKLLIKFTLVRNFDKNYRKIIDLSPYTEWSNYSKLSSYLDDCVCEMLQMKADEIKDCVPLYEFVTNNNIVHVLYSNQLAAGLAKIDYSIRYPIYHDIISEQVKALLERTDLLKKLSQIQFYTKLDVADQDDEEKKIILDHDSTYNIAQYLTNDNLLNFITAFDDSNKRTLEVEMNTKVYETSTSNDTKRARLK